MTDPTVLPDATSGTATQSSMERGVQQYQDQLIGLEGEASKVLSREYRALQKSLQQELDDWTAKINDARGAGKSFSPSWLFQQARTQELLTQAKSMVDGYSVTVRDVTEVTQQVGVRAGLMEAGRQLLAVSGNDPQIASFAAGWAALPDATIRNLTGALTGDTPLRDLIRRDFSNAAIRTLRYELIQGAALGKSAQEIAKRVSASLNASRLRAETIVRTELLRASNNALLAAFRQLPGLVKGWRWSAALQARTCAACLAMNGKVFPISDPMPRHVNCRCSVSPWMGNGKDAPFANGEAWLRKQNNATKLSVLGSKKALSAFNAHQLMLKDFVKRRENGTWGASITNGGYAHALRNAQREGRGQQLALRSIPAPDMKALKQAYVDVFKEHKVLTDDEEAMAKLFLGTKPQLEYEDRIESKATDISKYVHGRLDLVWKPAPVEHLPVGTVFIPTQAMLDRNTIAKLIKKGLTDDDAALVILIDGEYYVVQGHQHIIAARLRGDKSIPVKILYVSSATKTASFTPIGKPAPTVIKLKQPTAVKQPKQTVAKKPTAVKQTAPFLDHLKALNAATDLTELEQLMEIRYPNTDFDLAGITMENARETVIQYSRLADEFPDAAAGLEYIGTYSSAEAQKKFSERERQFQDSYAHTTGPFMFAAKRIGLNPSYFGDDDFQSRLAGDTAMGWHPLGTQKVGSIITHEFGHVVNFWQLATTTFAYRKEVSKSGDEAIASMVQLFMDNIMDEAVMDPSQKPSRYAMNDPFEFFAETFSSSYYTPRDLQKDACGQMDRYFEVVGRRESQWVPAKDWEIIENQPVKEQNRILEDVRKVWNYIIYGHRDYEP